METAAAVLMTRLGLDDDELCAVLDTDPLSVLTDDLAHRPEIGILLALTDDPARRIGEPVLQRWLRRRGPSGVPVEHLLARDFGAFEDALTTLDDRGFVIRGGGSGFRGLTPAVREGPGWRRTNIRLKGFRGRAPEDPST